MRERVVVSDMNLSYAFTLVTMMPAGHKLIDLIKETAEIPDAGEPGSAPGYNAITELCLQHVPAARQLAGQIRSSLSPQVYRWDVNPVVESGRSNVL